MQMGVFYHVNAPHVADRAAAALELRDRQTSVTTARSISCFMGGRIGVVGGAELNFVTLNSNKSNCFSEGLSGSGFLWLKNEIIFNTFAAVFPLRGSVGSWPRNAGLLHQSFL